MINSCPVPKDQRPLNEYNELKNSVEFKWTTENSTMFFKTLTRITLTSTIFICFIFISIYDWKSSALKLLLKILYSFFLVFTIIVLRLYLSWYYVYNRLMNASVNYEESGWYDGQTWIKSNAILIQDRLIGIYEVQPILKRLKLLLTIGIGIDCTSFTVYI